MGQWIGECSKLRVHYSKPVPKLTSCELLWADVSGVSANQLRWNEALFIVIPSLRRFASQVIAYLGFLLLNDPVVGKYHFWSEPLPHYWERQGG